MGRPTLVYVASEFEEQATVVAWADATPVVVNGATERLGLWLHAVPNGEAFNRGGFTDGQRMARWTRLRKLGFRGGVPDLYLDLPRGPFHGLRLEMKRRGGRPTPDQTDRLKRLRAVGYFAAWSDSADAAISILKDYFALGEFRNDSRVD